MTTTIDKDEVVASLAAFATLPEWLADALKRAGRPEEVMAVRTAQEWRCPDAVPGLEMTEILRRADVAMYAAKRARTSGWHLYTGEETAPEDAPPRVKIDARPT